MVIPNAQMSKVPRLRPLLAAFSSGSLLDFDALFSGPLASIFLSISKWLCHVMIGSNLDDPRFFSVESYFLARDHLIFSSA